MAENLTDEELMYIKEVYFIITDCVDSGFNEVQYPGIENFILNRFDENVLVEDCIEKVCRYFKIKSS